MFTIAQLVKCLPVIASFVIFLQIIIHFFITKIRQYIFLVFFYFSLTLFWAIQLFYINSDNYLLSYLFPFLLPIFLLILPSLYLFVRSFVGNLSFGQIIIHYFPSLFIFILLTPFWFVPVQDRIKFLEVDFDKKGLLLYIHYVYLISLFVSILGQFVFYLIKFIGLLSDYNRKIETYFSNLDNKRLDWAYWAFSLVFVLFILLNFSDVFAKGGIASLLVVNILLLGIMLMIYISARRLDFIEISQTFEEEETPKPETEKQKKKIITKSRKDEIYRQLEELKNNKPEVFYDPNISILKLAELLSTNTTYLSQVINEYYNCNFYQFVNQVRLKRAVELLQNPNFEKYTIEYIAQLCGFNSRSTFYEAFKKFYGETPLRFRSSN